MDQIPQELELAFNSQNKIELQTLLEPIEQAKPSGEPPLNDPGYQKILDARIQDDNSTPRGVWELELRQADWGTVYEESINLIATRSKDLQTAVWLFEAQINRLGFRAIAPGVHMLSCFVASFWESLHPNDIDMEHRVNIFEWLNSKLAITLKHIPFTQRPDSGRHYNWADWELALHQSQVRNAHPEQLGSDEEHNIDTISQSINLTPAEYYQQLYADMQMALYAVDDLSTLLDELLANESPSLAGFASVLEDIAGMAYQQLDQRGKLPIENSAELGADEWQDERQAEQPLQSEHGLRNRRDAYAALQSIADYLKVDDPHSPAPYLLYKAIDWGTMNTAQLYSELFVKQQGHINIFEILGIDKNEHETIVS